MVLMPRSSAVLAALYILVRAGDGSPSENTRPISAQYPEYSTVPNHETLSPLANALSRDGISIECPSGPADQSILTSLTPSSLAILSALASASYSLTPTLRFLSRV